MTFFMQRLAQVLGASEVEDVPPLPMRPSRAGQLGEGVDRQIAFRSLGEQLVCEANAIIADPADHLTLTDEVGGNTLAFTIRCRDHTARVSTLIQNRTAYGQIVTSDDPDDQPHELSDPEALPDLLIRLCVVAGLHSDEPAHLI